ncbi:MAG: FlgD immunoglobulin-like domain containing protein [bacterium]|nr:FlgD immunoglobulin-like domain containing protein [bacterium]
MKKSLLLGMILLVLVSITASYAAVLVTNQSGAYTAPTATITFRLNTYGIVTVYIKEAAGNTTVKTINAGPKSAGVHNVIWNGVKDGGAKATTGQYYAVVYSVGTAIPAYTPFLASPISFTQGAGIAFNKNTADATYFGRLYASDHSIKQIYMYYPGGTFIRSTTGYDGVWGTWGSSAPYGVAVDNLSVVWVNERANGRTILFDPEINYKYTLTGTGMTRIGISVTGDTTNGAFYNIFGSGTDAGKRKVVAGAFDPLTSIYNAGGATDLKYVLPTPDNSMFYTAQAAVAPAVKQFAGADYSYSQTGWTTSVDSALSLDFTPDGQHLWVANYDTSANVKKVRISDGAVVDSFQAGTGIAGRIAVDPAGNIAVFDGGNEFGSPRLNIYQPPDSGSNWQSQTNNFNFVAPLNLAPSVDSTTANPGTIPADGATSSQLTVYVSDPDGFTDVTTVRVNLSQIGGSATQTMTRIGGSGIDATYQTTVVAAVSSKAGNLLLPVYAYDSGGNVATENVNLTVTSGAISGKVTIYGSTVAVPGATVTATGGSGPYTAISGSDGSYLMVAGIGTYTVSASRTGWNAGAAQSNVNVVFASTTQNVNVSVSPKSVADAKSLSLPATAAIGGVITAPRGTSVPPPWGLAGQYYLADEGSADGLRINDTGTGRYPQLGEKVVVEGTILPPSTQYNEVLIVNPAFYAQLGSAGILGSPVTATCVDVSSTNFGKLIMLSNVTVTSVTPGATYSTYNIQDGSGSALVYYDSNSTVSDVLLPLPSIGTTVNVIGVVSQQAPWVNPAVAVVKPWYRVQVTVNPASVVLAPSGFQTFNASGGTAPYTWTSSDTTVGSIDSTSGLFTAIAEGNCTVTATDTNGYRGYAAVRVETTAAPLAVDQTGSIYRREVFGELFE